MKVLISPSSFGQISQEPLELLTSKGFEFINNPYGRKLTEDEVIELGTEGGAGNLIICEVIRMHIDESILDENNQIDAHKIDLVSRMGGDWYCRADAHSMFEIKKPITTCGIGYDALPADLLNSSVLSVSDLARLAGIESLPDETEVNEYKLTELSDLFMTHIDDAAHLENALHVRAKELLTVNKLVRFDFY